MLSEHARLLGSSEYITGAPEQASLSLKPKYGNVLVQKKATYKFIQNRDFFWV